MPSTTRSAWRGRRLDVAPAVMVLVEDVRRGARVVGSEGGILDEGRVGGEGLRDRMERGQLLELDRDERGRLLGGIVGLGGDRGDGFAVVLRLACGQDGAVACAAARSGASGRAGRRRSSRDGRPGPRSAALVSIRPIRARATSRVTSFTWRTSSWGRSATYCCSPVTRARPPTRAAGSPTLTAAPRSHPGRPTARRRVAPRASSRGFRRPRRPGPPR